MSERVQLKQFWVGANLRISSVRLNGMSVEERADEVGRGFDFQLRGFLWGRKAKRYEFVAPADWWAAVKLRFFPAWWLARWPAQMRREVVDVNALYPTLQLELPDHATTLVIERFDPFHPVEKW